jgi:hypothetical protein
MLQYVPIPSKPLYPANGVSSLGWSHPPFPGICALYSAVLRIHDILVWIRIRGSMPLTNGCGSGSFSIHH